MRRRATPFLLDRGGTLIRYRKAALVGIALTVLGLADPAQPPSRAAPRPTNPSAGPSDPAQMAAAVARSLLAGSAVKSSLGQEGRVAETLRACDAQQLLWDMHGNVLEWRADWYGQGFYQNSPRRDLTGPGSGTNRVLRGGAWGLPGEVCRAARRFPVAADIHDASFGLRVVLAAAGL